MHSDSGMEFSPKLKTEEDLRFLEERRRSDTGPIPIPISLDMDLLADEHPREAQFLRSENSLNTCNVLLSGNDKTTSQPAFVADSPRISPGRKTPRRRFFKTEAEREYARNLMKELVQLYIVEGVHGKDAFRRALAETKRRIYVRRGEEVPLSPVGGIPPIAVSPYPKISPPTEVPIPYSPRKIGTSPVKLPSMAGTPSRVQSMVAAIQSSPKRILSSSAKRETRRTQDLLSTKLFGEPILEEIADAKESEKVESTDPSSGPIQAHVSMQASIAALDSPVKSETREHSPVKKQIDLADLSPPRSSARLRKNQAIVEHASPSRRGKKSPTDQQKAESPPTAPRSRRAAAIAAVEAKETPRSAKKKTVTESSDSKRTRSKPTAKRTRKIPDPLDTIPEDQPIIVPIRPSRKAKTVAAAVIKK